MFPAPSFDPATLPSALNAEQLDAARTEGVPLLVLAGAGSGKTRVITYRIANLIRVHGVTPWRILAVTFTNKAAGEMRERLQRLLGPSGADVWVSTFHAAGARILRRDGERIGLSRDFVIYDDADQLAAMKRVMKAMEIDPKLVDPRRLLSRIDEAKNHGRSPDAVAKMPAHDETSRLFPEVYRRYQRALAQSNAVDFGDLLTRILELFEAAPDVLDRYRGRLQHILVDEFQDTNGVQYRLLKLLAGDGRGLCVVGDDDQSIYRWRGAEVTNLLSFPDDFPGAKVVKLEQNYRSTQVILDAAHAVISKNPRRMEKKLWTEQAGFDPLDLIVARDERDEAGRIADRTRASILRGVDPKEIAIFYRTNAQSRVLEEAFRLARLPYAIVRGRSFYDRAEVRDLVAYLRLAINPRSDADALRVLNKPARGIGDTTAGRVEAAASRLGISIVDACARADEIPELNAGARTRVRGFASIVGQLALGAAEESAGAAAANAMRVSGLEQAFLDDGSDEAFERLENVRELVGAAREWDEDVDRPRVDEEEQRTPLGAFLEQVALLGDADQKVEGPRVSLMTLHAAKGLEFEEVYLTGLEETVFPHARSLGENGGPEEVAEERRLCYVGFTRAKRLLVLSLASSRTLFGELRFNAPSRFLGDVPRELFGAGAAPAARAPRGEHVVYDDEARGPELSEDDGFFDEPVVDYSYDQRPRPLARPSEPVRRRPQPFAATLPGSGHGRPGSFRPGTRVRHAQFGEGVVEAAEGDKVSVRFSGVGVKRVVSRFVQPA